MSNIDPRLGTWKLNVAKSKFSSAYLAALKMAPPKEETIAFRELGADEIELTITGVQTACPLGPFRDRAKAFNPIESPPGPN